jgi:hypothetical protein
MFSIFAATPVSVTMNRTALTAILYSLFTIHVPHIQDFFHKIV